MNNLELTDFFTTKRQAADFEARLSEVEASLYEVDLNLENVLQEHFGIEKKDKFITLLRENKIPLDSNPAIKEFFNKIKEAISSMPEATITLAIEPNEEILKSIADWFLLNLDKQILIDAKIDQGLVAGATVDYQGKHFDSSIKNIFKQMFEMNPTNIEGKKPDTRQTDTTVKAQTQNSS